MHIMHMCIIINVIFYLVNKFRKTLADNIRTLRGEMTQTAFARKVDVDQATINRIEQGLQNVTIDTLERLCKKLKCSAGDLLDQRID